MIKNIYILKIGFLCFVSLLQAQKSLPISQFEAVNRAVQENQNLKISVEDFNLARADYR